ncbi:putative chitinase [Bradyrhizobium sp. JR1.7]|uniref:glycoside hydrolase family 19 protein n=1 Tax=unclassified Bradyrhizobium TaxID=2631580 RepID=UPI00339AB296
MKLEAETLRHMWPRAPQAKIDTICAISEEVFAEHDIDDPKVVVQLMANISHENGAGTIVRESGNYRAERIVEVFGAGKSSAKVTPQEAAGLAHNEVALFERVYNLPSSPKLAKELGNHLPGDGYKYRGGGDLQLTGRDNYERIGEMTGHPELADNPALLADPKISFEVAVAEFVALGCVGPAKKGMTERVRRLVNGGTNGMHEVSVWVARWSDAMPDIEAPVEAPRGADTNNKTLGNSKIMKGVISTAVPTVIGAASKMAENGNTETHTVSISDVADKVAQASDTITTVQVAADSATAIVHTVKPFLGVPPNLWAAIAIAASVIALAALAYTGWQRWTKLRDQGV